MDLTFKREFSYYLLTIYVPCCMLVIVSWVSFWLDPNAVPARVSLGVTTLLTMSTQTASINNSLPPVAYTKAIDVWTGVSFFGHFGYILATMILAIFGTFCEGLPDFRYFASIYNSLPLVAYSKAIEVWTGVSLFGHLWHLLGRNSRFLIFLPL